MKHILLITTLLLNSLVLSANDDSVTEANVNSSFSYEGKDISKESVRKIKSLLSNKINFQEREELLKEEDIRRTLLALNAYSSEKLVEIFEQAERDNTKNEESETKTIPTPTPNVSNSMLKAQLSMLVLLLPKKTETDSKESMQTPGLRPNPTKQTDTNTDTDDSSSGLQ